MVDLIFSSETSEFIINKRSDDDKSKIISSVSIKYPFRPYFDDGKEFSCPSDQTHYFYLTHRPGCKEIDTCILRYHDTVRKTDAENRGWFIPFNVLFTEDESFANNQYFREYSFYAFFYLLSIPQIQEYLLDNDALLFSELLDMLSTNSLSELSPDINPDYSSWYNSIIVLDLFKDKPKIKLPDIQPALIEKGFVFGKSAFSNSKVKAIKDGENKKWGINYITLKSCSKQIFNSEKEDNVGFAHSYYSEVWEHVFVEDNPYIRFFDLYQIIEVLMDEVLVKILESMIRTIKQENGGLRDYDTILKNYVAEKKRISIVFDCGKINCNGDDNIDNKQFLEACNEFLKANGHKDANELASALYSVRNMIVHRFRIMMSDDNRTKLKNLNEHFILFITRLFRNYSLEPIQQILDGD